MTEKTEHYITLFDSHFLPQGLALLASMKRHAGKFCLWVLCMDDACFQFLRAQGDDHVRPVSLADIETPELLAVKRQRTTAEYCWTLTPFTPRIVFERDQSVGRVTYIDADIHFLHNPGPLFSEFEQSGKAVLITEHAYAADMDASRTSGKYCVQFMTFKRGDSEEVRAWWESRCIEWCYARVEDGKFGDQKYLDDWPERFPDAVHVLEGIHQLLAPWNAWRFPHCNAIIYHFHGTRLLGSGDIFLGFNPLPETVIRWVYTAYHRDLKDALSQLSAQGIPCPAQITLARIFRVRLVGWMIGFVRWIQRPLKSIILN